MESAETGRSVQISIILGVFFMYISSNPDQITIEEFFLPFGGKLLKKNRWVKLASIMPWEHIEQIYMAAFQSENGRPALSSRIAFGAIFIKENDHLTDEGTVEAIAENPYMQYFLGLTGFQTKPLFDASMMVHFRKRFPVEELAKINEYICTSKWPDQQRNVDRNDTQDEPQDEPQQGGEPEGSQEPPAVNKQKESSKSGKIGKKARMLLPKNGKRNKRKIAGSSSWTPL